MAILEQIVCTARTYLAFSTYRGKVGGSMPFDQMEELWDPTREGRNTGRRQSWSQRNDTSLGGDSPDDQSCPAGK